MYTAVHCSALLPVSEACRRPLLRIADPLATVAAGVLAENNRLAEIIRICNSFDDLMAAARGEVTATITTAAVRSVLLSPQCPDAAGAYTLDGPEAEFQSDLACRS